MSVAVARDSAIQVHISQCKLEQCFNKRNSEVCSSTKGFQNSILRYWKNREQMLNSVKNLEPYVANLQT
jgi:hypothetical protein